jgi:hypothetical protein
VQDTHTKPDELELLLDELLDELLEELPPPELVLSEPPHAERKNTNNKDAGTAIFTRGNSIAFIIRSLLVRINHVMIDTTAVSKLVVGPQLTQMTNL